MTVLLGYPWDIRTVRNPARGLRLSTQDNQVKHQMLSGAVRTTGRPNTPRTWSASWAELAEADARWFQYLARRIGGPGPFVVIDPATQNFQRPLQSVGRGSASQWAVSSGSLTQQADSTILWANGAANAELTWVHPVWGRWPTTPGQVVSFRHTSTANKSALAFYNRSGTFLSTVSATGGNLTTTAPATAQWIRPHLIKPATGSLTIPPSCFRYGTEIGAAWYEGEHCAAMSILTPVETIQVLPRRDLTLELLEL
ncbi:hypothetical protein VA596_49820 [Amycolatopsis sp., V23-08]|uniref:Uncharacterized protein n=1 Tax=Amycolatopsis heterodermiae TaxID=3110235 RepID=A0ABU5RPB0_9PSEU|nr:hypothetical protein [Amycolatopsis sp., V23-08]MEA5367709.1 hypothetical protein [Amycolatopsis sp., V23-08]